MILIVISIEISKSLARWLNFFFREGYYKKVTILVIDLRQKLVRSYRGARLLRLIFSLLNIFVECSIFLMSKYDVSHCVA